MKHFLIVVYLLIFNTGVDEFTTTTASYYGKEHHGKLMSNGKKFNMYNLTTAHRNLKFGTKLLVTNPDNSKSVIVEVTDRGPFVKDRGLDLSYAAFKEISNISVGKIKVQYKILN